MNDVSQDPAYGRLKDRLIASTGLAFYADRDLPLTELIGERLSALGLPDCSSYADFLADGRSGSAEMDVLIGQLTIGETAFFRDHEQYAAIRDIVIPDILERKRASRDLRIWSAGCATGAEPYSLAILLARELAGRIAGWQVDIRATDLNRDFLAQAMEGKFREWALRFTSDEVKRECFSKEGRTWTIHPRYKQWVSFHHRNLIEGGSPSAAGAPFDLILCRNVMIYFSPEMNRRLIGQFHESLGDGGWLVVGASECHPENYRAFRNVSAAGAMLYQKSVLPQTPPPRAISPPVQPAEPESKRCAGPLSRGGAILRECPEAMDRQQRMEAVWRERAHRLSQRPVLAGAGRNTSPVIVVGVGKEFYGIDLPDVTEVLPPVRATPVPGAAAAFSGVINVHGEIRPVIDLRRVLGMDVVGQETVLARVILLRKEGREMGLQIDSVQQIRWIGSAELQSHEGASPCVKGSTKDMLMLLSTDALFAELLKGLTP